MQRNTYPDWTVTYASFGRGVFDLVRPIRIDGRNRAPIANCRVSPRLPAIIEIIALMILPLILRDFIPILFTVA